MIGSFKLIQHLFQSFQSFLCFTSTYLILSSHPISKAPFAYDPALDAADKSKEAAAIQAEAQLW